MTIIDVTKELSDILTSAFGKGWGWLAVFLLTVILKKSTFVHESFESKLVLSHA